VSCECKFCNSGGPWEGRFMHMAEMVAGWSKDPSTKTGAVIVGPDNGVISVGFNGFPAGMSDDPDLYNDREEKYSRIIHCEMNAILRVTRPLPEGCSLYTWPFMSCDRCVVHMIQAGIRRFVAPACTDEDKLVRWGPIFEKTRKYIEEVEGFLLEL
jgi:dCMP deaminase